MTWEEKLLKLIETYRIIKNPELEFRVGTIEFNQFHSGHNEQVNVRLCNAFMNLTKMYPKRFQYVGMKIMIRSDYDSHVRSTHIKNESVEYVRKINVRNINIASNIAYDGRISLNKEEPIKLANSYRIRNMIYGNRPKSIRAILRHSFIEYIQEKGKTYQIRYDLTKSSIPYKTKKEAIDAKEFLFHCEIEFVTKLFKTKYEAVEKEENIFIRDRLKERILFVLGQGFIPVTTGKSKPNSKKIYYQDVSLI